MYDIQTKQELKLVTTEKFAGLDVGFYQDGKGDIYMTRNQIGEALEYAQPQRAMNKIHERNKERLDKFSVVVKLGSTDGKAYDTHLYNEKGVYEIMRKSNQPKADEFYDFVYDVIEGLRKGELTITPSYQIDDPIERAKRWIEEEQRRQLLEGEVLELTDKVEEYEPKARYVDEILSSTDTMTVTQIAKDYGMTAQQLNKVLNELGVQYKAGGQWVLYAKHAGNGYTKSKTHSYKKTDGTKGANVQTRWTQKGRLFLHDTLTANGYVAEMDKK